MTALPIPDDRPSTDHDLSLDDYPRSAMLKQRLDNQFRAFFNQTICKQFGLQPKHPVRIVLPNKTELFAYLQNAGNASLHVQIPRTHQSAALLTEKVTIQPLSPSGFLSTLSHNYQFTIPRKIQSAHQIYNRDIVTLTVLTHRGRITFNTQVHQTQTKRDSATGYPSGLLRVTVPQAYRGLVPSKSMHYIESLSKTAFPNKSIEVSTPEHVDMVELLQDDPDLILTEYTLATIQVWSHTNPRTTPIIIPRHIEVSSDFLTGLLTYFSRGYPQGKGWSMAFSNPDLLSYIFHLRAQIICNDRVSCRLVYTSPQDEQEAPKLLADTLHKYWIEQVPLLKIVTPSLSCKIRQSKRFTKILQKTHWRPHGTLYVTDARILPQTIFSHLIIHALAHKIPEASENVESIEDPFM